jgi:hypothetical protein
MIKRKPGRPRKTVETFAEFAEREKRKPGRPRKNAVESRPVEPDFHRYCIRFPDGGFQRVDADSMEQHGEFGFLIFRRHGRMVGAFREWDYATEDSELGASPPKVTLSHATEELQSTTDSTYAVQNPMRSFTIAERSSYGPDTPGVERPDTGQVPHVETSPNGAQTITFANGVELTEADRPE